MTPDQFAALVELAGLRKESTRDLVRLVLIDGEGVTAAAHQAGISPSAASHAVARVRRVLELAREVIE